MDKCNSVEELDRWASEHGLLNDDMVNLRRLQLLAEAISNPQNGNACETCGKRYKEKKNLFRHIRTVHQKDTQHECSICQTKFVRSDHLKRHLRAHSRKRKHDDEENHGPVFIKKKRDENNSVSTALNQFDEEKTGTCNWCMQEKALVSGKKFCQTCAEQGRECGSCHRPLPERFFSKAIDICDSCTSRRERFVAVNSRVEEEPEPWRERRRRKL